MKAEDTTEETGIREDGKVLMYDSKLGGTVLAGVTYWIPTMPSRVLLRLSGVTSSGLVRWSWDEYSAAKPEGEAK